MKNYGASRRILKKNVPDLNAAVQQARDVVWEEVFANLKGVMRLEQQGTYIIHWSGITETHDDTAVLVRAALIVKAINEVLGREDA